MKPMTPPAPTAAILLIGNEILSGRTQDKNLNYIAKKLTEKGIRLKEARLIGDDEREIIHTVNELRAKYTYLFTTGGIGPTHDDITAPSIAKAFGVEWKENAEARKRLEAHYRGADVELNEARLRMAKIPEGAKLIDNPVSAAPGFVVENVYVMAGVPRIMNAMFDGIIGALAGGAVVHSRTVSCTVAEGDMAAFMAAIERDHEGVEVGSYPFIKSGKLGTSVVIRGVDERLLEMLADKVRAFALERGAEIFEIGGNAW